MPRTDFRDAVVKQPTTTASLTIELISGATVTTKAGSGFKWRLSKSSGIKFLEFTENGTDEVHRIPTHALLNINAELDDLEA